MNDPYQTLGVSRDASEDEIKKAYRKLAHQFHPDKNPGDVASEEKFKEINNAYQQITNPDQSQQGAPSVDDFNFNFGNGMFNDVFQNIFGGAQQARGRNVTAAIGLTFEESCFGCVKEIRVNLDEPCAGCSGVGAAAGDFTTCQACNGTGQSTIKRGFVVITGGMCQPCSGRGVIITKSCGKCLGKGTSKVDRVHNVQIPSCAQNGAALAVPGAGLAGPQGSRPGDLIVRIQVVPHPHFTREGLDVVSNLEISLKEALLGGEREVSTIHQSTKVQIPPLTKPGQKLSLKGLGAKNPNTSDAQFGRHLLNITVRFPTTLTDEQRQTLEKIL